jgi:hypothetical protein
MAEAFMRSALIGDLAQKSPAIQRAGLLRFRFWLPSIVRDIVTAFISRVDHCRFCCILSSLGLSALD